MAFWYTRAMNDSERSPASVTEAVWPPAPLRDEPPPLFLRVEGMQLTQSGGRLFVVNKSIRRAFILEVCIIGASLFSPWISFWTSPFHHATLPGLLPYVTSAYRSCYGLYLFMLFPLAVFWWMFTAFGNLQGVTLDRHDRWVKVGGRGACPMNRIEAVQIKPMSNALLGRRYTVSLQWGNDDPTARWQRELMSAPGNRCTLGALRHEANADQVAGIIAAFIGVPVQKMNGISPSPERDQRS